MKNSLLTILVMSCLAPTMAQAYTLTIQTDLNLNQIDSKYTAALISCFATQLNGHSDSGQTYAPLITGSANDGIDTTVDATKPLFEYDSIECAVQLCRIEGDSDSCNSPNAPSDYDERPPHRISHSQSLADSLLMVVPPPSYQMAGQNKRTNQPAKNSGGGENTGKGSRNATIGSVAGDANTAQGATETALAAIKVGYAIYKKDVPALGAALTDLTMGGTGLATSAAFGAADSDGIGIVGDMAGLGLGFASAAASAAAGGAAVTVATAALPLTATLTGSLALGSKINKVADEPFLWWLEQLVGYDEEDPEGYKEAVEAMKVRKAAEAAGAANNADNQQNGTPQSSRQSSDTSPQNNPEDRSPTAGRGSQPSTDTAPEGGSTPATQPEQQNSPDNANTNEGASNAQWTVIAREEGDGKTSITWTLTGTPRDRNGNNQDGIYTTEYSNDGTYTVSDMWGNEVSSGTGKPSDDSVPGATTTETSDDGTEATFAGSSDESSDEDESDNGGSSDDGCNQGDGNCSNDDDEAPAEDDEEATTDTETSDNSTPNPNDQGDRSEGLAWAMQNPNNPLARQILKDAATAIIENSAYCQLGCSEAEAKGGLLWAMLNPGNPLAQNILANTAQAIAGNAGSGQTGGVDDNPAYESNEGVSEQDLMRIELIIAGGGVVDPPEASGSGSGSAPDSPLTGGVGPIPSGPINSDNLEFYPLQGGALLDDGGPDDPTDTEDLQLKLNNSGRIQ